MIFTDWKQVPADFPPCVYYLADPRTPNAPRYVGSSRALQSPFKKHMRRSARSRDVGEWFRELRAANVTPILRVVLLCDDALSAHRAEWRIALRWKRRGIGIVGEHVPPTADEDVVSAGQRFRSWSDEVSNDFQCDRPATATHRMLCRCLECSHAWEVIA